MLSWMPQLEKGQRAQVPGHRRGPAGRRAVRPPQARLPPAAAAPAREGAWGRPHHRHPRLQRGAPDGVDRGQHRERQLRAGKDPGSGGGRACRIADHRPEHEHAAAAVGGEAARAHPGGDRGRALVAARPDAPALPGERGSRAGPSRGRPLARRASWHGSGRPCRGDRGRPDGALCHRAGPGRAGRCHLRSRSHLPGPAGDRRAARGAAGPGGHGRGGA